MTSTLYRDIYDELRDTPTIDAHEHLPSEVEALGRRVDFFTLFEHYCKSDLVAAGASQDDIAYWLDRDKPLGERWQRFKPFWSAIRTGGYARAALIVMRDLLGFPDLNDDTVQGVSDALVALNKPGFYDVLLRQKCNLAACIECWHLYDEGLPDYFYHVAPARDLINLHEPTVLPDLQKTYRRSIHSLDDVLHVMTMGVEAWLANPKVVGTKIGHAYQRSLRFEKRTRHEAELVFNRILTNESHQISLQEAMPLLDYLLFELVARAEAVGLPLAIHTGLQAGNFHRIENANPLHLQSLLEEFPRARFDLYHGGMPWVREIAVLAKQFPGVYLNMAWMHIIDPAQARSALSEWLDIVPNTKIFGFGGDYAVVEKVYGHLVIARQNIARVLADKVEEGAYSRAEASMLVRRLMFENPNEFYRLHLAI